jgi:SAM-dependent methyltransferase
MNCGLVSLYPRPTVQELMENYEDYLPVHPEEIDKWEKMMKPVVNKSADLIESQINTGRGRLLDVGCAYGFFLHEMQSRGWQVEGVEISGTGKQYVQNTWGINVYPEPLENLDIPENSFDVITLFYLIEHVGDPLELLNKVNRILKPGGLILLRWPHSTPTVRILGPLSKKLDLYHTPYHLYDFSPKTMKKLLTLSGFKDVETMIGGYTLPSREIYRWTSVSFSGLGEFLYRLSGGKILLPGVSKTTIAVKAN